ncbi:MFS-type transporter SLC18B1-like [Pollicipes pollicipes]|uniref:MFS-type transporter SLC18B1-like n=1 Tax=Pollicipes pollicipes TaxID=41117 RepID=UPI0018855D23|nr:MFS-type transporter SLC18B1-like [Pollicipes pollicipes]
MESERLLSEEGDETGSELDTDSGHQSAQCPSNASGTSDDGYRLEGEQHATQKSGMTSVQKKLLASLAVVRMLNGSLIAVMIPFFPVEAASRGVSQTVISGLFSCFSVARMATNPFIGRLVLLVGLSRLYNLGLATAGLTTIIFGTLNYIADTSTFVTACYLVRLVEAIGSEAITICGYTIVGNQFPSRVNRVVALLNSALTIGLALTPAIWGGLFALGGFGTPFFTLGVIMLLMAALNLRLMPTIQGTTNRSSMKFSKTLWLFAKSTGNWVCMVTVFTYASYVSTVASAFAPYANDALGVPPSQVGFYYLVNTSGYAIMNLFWGWLADRQQNRYKIMSPCLIVSSFGIFLLSPSPLLGLKPVWWLTGLGMAIAQAFSGGALTPCFKTMLESSIEGGLEDDLSTQSLVSSAYQMAFSIGVAVGPLLGGILVDIYGFPWMTTMLAFLMASVGLLVGVKAISASQAQCRDKK